MDNKDVSRLEQLIQLYQVTNGLNTLEADSDGHPLKDIWLIPGYYLLSLHEVVETLTTMTKSSGIWNPTWLPLFASRAGDFLVYDTENGHINEILIKESLIWKVAPNIQEFLQGIARKLKDGRILINENGFIDEISTDVQKHVGHDDTIVDALYLSTSDKNTFNLDILVEEENVAQPVLRFNCNNMPSVCENIKDAIDQRKPTLLHRITDERQIRRNRYASCAHMICRRPVENCDEYPFASSSEGGAGAITKCVPARENSSQGGQLAGFYRNNNISNNDPYIVERPAKSA